MRVSHSKKHQKCEVAVVKEDKKRNVFLYFYASWSCETNAGKDRVPSPVLRKRSNEG